MSIYEAREQTLIKVFMQKSTVLLILSMLFWLVGAPSLLQFAHAAQVTNFKDTISDSNLSATPTHVIQFNTTAVVNPAATLEFQLDPTPGPSSFVESFAAATSTSITFVAGATTYSVVNACTSGNQLQAVGNYNGGTDENLTLTLCAGAALIATSTAITFTVGTSTPLWTNPATTGSYVIRLGGTSGNTGDTRIAVLQNVTVTASVNTSFTFTVSGLATSSALFAYPGILTTGSSTPTALPFNTLTPGASSTLGQTLSVTTNARNGFVVTVQENQPLTSSTGATIDLFQNGASTSVPTAWTAPSNILGQYNTYGHMGLTSDDQDLNGGEFVSGLYTGSFDKPRPVFSNNGPSDGTTQNKGKADVFYTIQIGTLQEAGNDYTNTLTYVATPTF